MVESQHVHLAKAIIGGERTIPVVIVGTRMLVGLFSGRVQQLPVSIPVVFIGSGVHIRCQVLVVVYSQRHIQPFCKQITLVIFQRRHQRMSFPVFLAVNDVLTHSGLYVLIHIGVGETQHQTVRPFLVDHPHFANDRFIMVRIIETFDAHLFIAVYPARLKVFYRSFNVIIIVRIVLKSIDLIGEAVLEGLSEVHVGFMRIE